MVEFRTSFAFRGWVRVRVLGYGFGVRGRKVKSRDCALASDLVIGNSKSRGRVRAAYKSPGASRQQGLATLDPTLGTAFVKS